MRRVARCTPAGGAVAGVPGVGAGTAGRIQRRREDVRSMLGLFAQLGKSVKILTRMDVPTFNRA